MFNITLPVCASAAMLLIFIVCLCVRRWSWWRKQQQQTTQKKSIAVCISGCIRSFPRASYREGLRKLLATFPDAHFFLVLKSKDVPHTKHPPLFMSKTGVDGFMKTMDVIRHNTKSVLLFDGFADEQVNHSIFASQVHMMSMCFKTASEHHDYDYYLRYRPDFVLLEANLPDTLNENTIYTTRKQDAIGSDQVFMFSNKLKTEWWDGYVMPTTNKLSLTKMLSPEYFIYNKLKPSTTVQNGPLFFGGLLRTNENHLMFWDDERKKEHTIIDDWKHMSKHMSNHDDDIHMLINALRNKKYTVRYQRYV